MKQKSSRCKGHHAAHAYDPADVSKFPAVIPQPEAKTMDTEQSDEAFYGSCDPDAEQEQKHRFFSERLQCVKYQRTDPVYRKPRANSTPRFRRSPSVIQ